VVALLKGWEVSSQYEVSFMASFHAFPSAAFDDS
jgi:hypothetical protein